MKLISDEEIDRLIRKRAMFPEDWCQAQLQSCEQEHQEIITKIKDELQALKQKYLKE